MTTFNISESGSSSTPTSDFELVADETRLNSGTARSSHPNFPNSGASQLLLFQPAFPSGTSEQGQVLNWIQDLDLKLDEIRAERRTSPDTPIEGDYLDTLEKSIDAAQSFAFRFFGPDMRPPAVLLDSSGIIEFLWRSRARTVEISFDPSEVRVWTRSRTSTEMWSAALDDVTESLPKLLETVVTPTE
jgi:hypothetical protein